MTEDIDMRTQLSQMTEITEQTIAPNLQRNADLDALYRACPTAFWLAPDADISDDPPRLAVTQTAPEPWHAGESHAVVQGRTTAIGYALSVAGPIFAATGLMLDRSQFDAHWWDPFVRALTSLVAFPLTITIGALLALLPVLAGVFAMGAAGVVSPAARRPLAWAGAGGVMGIAIAALFGAGGVVALALVTTSIACASIARVAIDWDDPALA